jgi:hypothetical protein
MKPLYLYACPLRHAAAAAFFHPDPLHDTTLWVLRAFIPLPLLPRLPHHAPTCAAADRAELEAALRKEADAIAAERAAVEARKDETLAFRRQLADQMRKQAETTDWVDRHYAEEADKEWDKREAVWNADAEARRSLMSDVAATRLAQMEDKLRGKALEREREAAEAAAERAARDAAEARDRAKGDERRRLVAQQAEYTRSQLAERARAAEAEKQAEYLSWRLQQKEEREYAARVQALLKVRCGAIVSFRKRHERGDRLD